MKVDPTVIPPLALLEVAEAIGEGDRKYGSATRLIGPPRRHVGGALRHILGYLAGDRVDHDSGLHPLAHAAARLLLAREIELHDLVDAVEWESEQ